MWLSPKGRRLQREESKGETKMHDVYKNYPYYIC